MSPWRSRHFSESHFPMFAGGRQSSIQDGLCVATVLRIAERVASRFRLVKEMKKMGTRVDHVSRQIGYRDFAAIGESSLQHVVGLLLCDLCGILAGQTFRIVSAQVRAKTSLKSLGRCEYAPTMNRHDDMTSLRCREHVLL